MYCDALAALRYTEHTVGCRARALSTCALDRASSAPVRYDRYSRKQSMIAHTTYPVPIGLWEGR